jgi:hypothetical protein
MVYKRRSPVSYNQGLPVLWETDAQKEQVF